MEPDEVVDQDHLDTSVAQETEGGSINPAWNDLLSAVPEDVHSQITPILSKWDQNFQSELSKVHSQYEPWKEILESSDPDGVKTALEVLNRINTNPQEVLTALQEFVQSQNPGSQEQQGQVDETEIPSEFLNHPEFKKLNQMVNTMAQYFITQQQTQQQSAADQELEQEIDRLKKEKGDFDVDWVLTKALTYGEKEKDPLEKAVSAYREFEQGILEKQRKPGPKLLGPGGIAPNNQVDMKSLDSKGRRDIMVQMLEAAKHANQ